MTVVKVPDLSGPKKQLCWRQAPDMVRCDRQKDHLGLHGWELTALIAVLEARITELERLLAAS